MHVGHMQITRQVYDEQAGVKKPVAVNAGQAPERDS